MTSARLNKALEVWKAATIDHRYVSDPESKELLRAIEAEPTAEPQEHWRTLPMYDLSDTEHIPPGYVQRNVDGIPKWTHWDTAKYRWDNAAEPEGPRLPIVPTRSPQVRAADLDLDTAEPEPRFKVGGAMDTDKDGVCNDHECILCEQTQKLLEEMNDKCVRYEKVIEGVKEWRTSMTWADLDDDRHYYLNEIIESMLAAEKETP
jgi:hypothetical protein